MEQPLSIKPSLVVFEGLDGTGKSTQLERFQRAVYFPEHGQALYEPPPMFTHQPSGASGIGPEIYHLTESVDWTQASPLTRQFLHLAAHTEHYEHDIIPALDKGRSVWMDRCWWSTYAYGWRDAVTRQLDSEQMLHLAQIPTKNFMPDVVFLFLHRFGPEQERAASDRQVYNNYMNLADMYPDEVEFIPAAGPGEVTAFISGVLYRRGLVSAES